MFTAPPPHLRFGFGCKIWLAYQLESLYFGVYYTWFARELNPNGNWDSSNPLWIYQTVDRAVKKGDLNHPKLKDCRARLLFVVNEHIAKERNDPHLARLLRREILNAPIELFRPQIWRIDLARIPISRIKLDRSTPGQDEQYINDLMNTEFEIVVE
jgi:hypothetical protein